MHPMRAFFLFTGLLAGSLVVAAALTYPAWLLVGLISIEPVHRVMHRIAMLVALIGLVVLTRRLGLSDRESLGYGLPGPIFRRQFLTAWLAGFALMLPLAALLLGLGIREVKPELDMTLGALLGIFAAGVLSGLAVAFIEETFFRGVLYSAVARSSGVAAAMVAPSLLYAALHFLGGRLRIPPEEVSWEHGFEVLANLFERYAEPLMLVDSLLALFMLGILFSVLRLRTGAIAACAGLHAAGVTTIAVLRETTAVNPEAAFGFLVGTYDGVIGWAALAWFGLLAAVYLRFSARSSR